MNCNVTSPGLDLLMQAIQLKHQALEAYAKSPYSKQVVLDKENCHLEGLFRAHDVLKAEIKQGAQVILPVYWATLSKIITQQVSIDPTIAGWIIHLRIKPVGGNFGAVNLNWF